MAWLGLFGTGKMTPKKIDKVAKLAANPWAQPDVRMREMQRLLDDGSAEALRGVLRRFAANASGHIADEDEKKFLEDAIVDFGEAALPALREYIKGNEQLTYALRAYKRIGGAAESVRFCLEALHAYGPEDHRSTEAKLQIVLQLQDDLADERVLPGLMPFLHDHADDVRWQVMEMLERRAGNGGLSSDIQANAARGLGELVISPDTGPRILGRAAELLCAREWPLPESVEALPAALEEQFFVDKKKFVRRRTKKG